MDEAVAQFRRLRADPAVFVRQVLGAEPDAWQAEVLAAAATRQRLALKASKGPGKSCVLAWLGWWWLVTRAHAKVICTSLSGDNLRDGLWTELAKWQRRSPLLCKAFEWQAERIISIEHPSTWWASARQWSRSANISQLGETLAGVHADNILFLIDEAGSIPDAVVATAEAGLANADPARGTEAKLVLAGNPTQLSGPLYRACTHERALWWVMEISGDPDDPRRAPRVSAQWAREQIAKFGRDNPWVLINVFGRFPPGQSNALLGVEEITAAISRSLAELDYHDEVKILGVDVARFGDDRSVLFLRQGRASFRPRVFRNLDTMTLASEVVRCVEQNSPAAVFIDQTGIGSGVVDRCRQLGLDVIGVDFGGRALDAHYANRRAQMWCLLAEWVRGGGCLPNVTELISELTAPTYDFDAAGKLRLESKADMKSRGLPSPDLADALALTFAAPVAHRAIRARLALRACPSDYDPYAKEARNVSAREC